MTDWIRVPDRAPATYSVLVPTTVVTVASSSSWSYIPVSLLNVEPFSTGRATITLNRFEMGYSASVRDDPESSLLRAYLYDEDNTTKLKTLGTGVLTADKQSGVYSINWEQRDRRSVMDNRTVKIPELPVDGLGVTLRFAFWTSDAAAAKTAAASAVLEYTARYW